MSGLRLGPDLVLPVDFATEGVAVVGMRGSGKSNTEVRWVEVLHGAGVPWVAVDPKGDWWGIRSSADGKGPGLPVPVFGGLHGDFPLEERLGARIADLLVDENLSVDEAAAAGVNDKGEPYEASGGGYGNAVRKLRRLGLIEGDASALRASDDLAAP